MSTQTVASSLAVLAHADYAVPSSFPGVTDQVSYLYYVFLKTSPRLSKLAAELGAAFSGILCGVVYTMIFLYFRSNAGDSVFLRSCIVFMTLLTTASFLIAQYDTHLISENTGNDFKTIVQTDITLDFVTMAVCAAAGILSQTFWSRKAIALWEFRPTVVVPTMFLLISYIILAIGTFVDGLSSCPIIYNKWDAFTSASELIDGIPEVKKWAHDAGSIGLAWTVVAFLSNSLIFSLIMISLFSKRNAPASKLFENLKSGKILQTLMIVVSESMVLVMILGVFYLVLAIEYTGVEGWLKTLYNVQTPLYNFGVLLSLLVRGQLREKSSRRSASNPAPPMPSKASDYSSQRDTKSFQQMLNTSDSATDLEGQYQRWHSESEQPRGMRAAGQGGSGNIEVEVTTETDVLAGDHEAFELSNRRNDRF